jgi:hypothetical protein
MGCSPTGDAVNINPGWRVFVWRAGSKKTEQEFGPLCLMGSSFVSAKRRV